MSEPFGGFCLILVGNFQQLPPVSDKLLYEVWYYAYILFDAIENVVQLVESQHQECDDPEQVSFKSFLTSFQEGNLYIQDWNVLKTRFIHTAHDSNDHIWDNAPHIFLIFEAFLSTTCQSFRPWEIKLKG